jgi:hypothetical protein
VPRFGRLGQRVVDATNAPGPGPAHRARRLGRQRRMVFGPRGLPRASSFAPSAVHPSTGEDPWVVGRAS